MDFDEQGSRDGDGANSHQIHLTPTTPVASATVALSASAELLGRSIINHTPPFGGREGDTGNGDDSDDDFFPIDVPGPDGSSMFNHYSITMDSLSLPEAPLSRFEASALLNPDAAWLTMPNQWSELLCSSSKPPIVSTVDSIDTFFFNGDNLGSTEPTRPQSVTVGTQTLPDDDDDAASADTVVVISSTTEASAGLLKPALPPRGVVGNETLSIDDAASAEAAAAMSGATETLSGGAELTESAQPPSIAVRAETPSNDSDDATRAEAVVTSSVTEASPHGFELTDTPALSGSELANVLVQVSGSATAAGVGSGDGVHDGNGKEPAAFDLGERGTDASEHALGAPLLPDDDDDDDEPAALMWLPPLPPAGPAFDPLAPRGWQSFLASSLEYYHAADVDDVLGLREDIQELLRNIACDDKIFGRRTTEGGLPSSVVSHGGILDNIRDSVYGDDPSNHNADNFAAHASSLVANALVIVSVNELMKKEEYTVAAEVARLVQQRITLWINTFALQPALLDAVGDKGDKVVVPSVAPKSVTFEPKHPWHMKLAKEVKRIFTDDVVDVLLIRDELRSHFGELTDKRLQPAIDGVTILGRVCNGTYGMSATRANYNKFTSDILAYTANFRALVAEQASEFPAWTQRVRHAMSRAKERLGKTLRGSRTPAVFRGLGVTSGENGMVRPASHQSRKVKTAATAAAKLLKRRATKAERGRTGKGKAIAAAANASAVVPRAKVSETAVPAVEVPSGGAKDKPDSLTAAKPPWESAHPVKLIKVKTPRRRGTKHATVPAAKVAAGTVSASGRTQLKAGTSAAKSTKAETGPVAGAPTTSMRAAGGAPSEQPVQAKSQHKKAKAVTVLPAVAQFFKPKKATVTPGDLDEVRDAMSAVESADDKFTGWRDMLFSFLAKFCDADADDQLQLKQDLRELYRKLVSAGDFTVNTVVKPDANLWHGTIVDSIVSGAYGRYPSAENYRLFDHDVRSLLANVRVVLRVDKKKIGKTPGTDNLRRVAHNVQRRMDRYCESALKMFDTAEAKGWRIPPILKLPGSPPSGMATSGSKSGAVFAVDTVDPVSIAPGIPLVDDDEPQVDTSDGGATAMATAAKGSSKRKRSLGKASSGGARLAGAKRTRSQP